MRGLRRSYGQSFRKGPRTSFDHKSAPTSDGALQNMLNSDLVQGIVSNVMTQVLQAFSDKPTASDPQQYHTINSAGMLFSSSVFFASHDVNTFDWIVDSGATDHMTSHVSLLHDVHPLPSPILVALPDGNVKFVAEVGCVYLTPQLTLSNVLFIPDFKQNLLSVGKLIEDANLTVHFFPSECIFQDHSGGVVLATAKKSGGLYKFKPVSSSSSSHNVFFNNHLCSVSSSWVIRKQPLCVDNTRVRLRTSDPPLPRNLREPLRHWGY
ncbi:hypothetical protein RND81_01G165500 [Saponaria officinalis]|uniref:Retrovirus-related Pol polyprotein from transposon TNT 1-94-like beta-barrel domain-containing protein n=1 Tax=Saponaria officinalis TaxID=3572 RepID=A0AAW1NG28_SAPOF